MAGSGSIAAPLISGSLKNAYGFTITLELMSAYCLGFAIIYLLWSGGYAELTEFIRCKPRGEMDVKAVMTESLVKTSDDDF